jgi:hypothetical protein
MGLKKDTFGKTKESKTDFTLASRDAKLQAEYVKNQEQRNKLHEEENKLLSKKGKISAEDEKRLGRIQAAYSKTVQKANELYAVAKQLDTTQDNIKRNAESQVDSWGSLSEIYKHSKEELQAIALKSVRLKDVSSSIAANETLTVKQRQGALNQISKFSDGMASISTKAAELAGLTSDDVEKRAIVKSIINDEIAAHQQQLAQMQKAGTYSQESLDILQETIQGKQDELNIADKISSQSKLQKHVQEELHEELESIQKTLLKIRSGVTMLFSGWQGALSLIAFGASEVAEHFGEMGKKIGVGMTQMIGLKTQVALVGAILGEEAGEAALDLAKDLGDSHHLTTAMAVDAGLLAANYGLSGKQAAFMSTAFGELSGKSYETGKNTGEYVKQLAMANGVAPTQVMQDVADNAEFFALYSKDGGKNIGDAAVAAAKLGVGLGTAAKVADHLLDYQSSVQDEMEASVLLGRDMNLSKARELAYNGDIAGALKEGLEAAGGIAAYNAMDPYQRAATAKAIGVSNAEMQQMVAHEETLNGMHGVGNQIYSQTSEILQNMGNSLTGKIFKGMGGLIIGAGELNKGLSAMGTSIGGMARGTKQMLKNLFAMIAPTKIIGKLKQFGGAIANSKVGSAIGGVAGKAKDYIAEKAGGLKDKLMDKVDFSGKAEEMVAEKKDAVVDSIKDKINPEKVTDGTDEAAKGDDGSAFKTKAENIAAGLKHFASGKVVLGALALIPIGIGLLGLLPGLPTLYLMGKMSFGSILLGFENLSLGLMAMGTGTTLAGAGVLALTSIALIMMLPGLVTLALMGAMAPLITLGFGALTAGLTALGGAAPLAGIGVAILMGLGLAFAFFGAGVMMVGTGIKLAMDGISSMVAVLPQLAANLGPLIGMILPIFGLAAAIMALSLSLMMLGTMGMIALPVLLALGALGAVAGGLFGGGGEGGSSNDEMIAILKSIDSKVGGAPAINMDSKKVTAASNDGAARRGDSGGTKY